MAHSSLYVIACFILALNSASGQLSTVNGRIKITVGTTAGCGDTVRFINDQLVPAYNQYGNFLDLEFVPWGRTTRNPDGSFTCQFGVNDCWANRLHRCALNMLRGNQTAQMNYMDCEFTLPLPGFTQGTYACAQASGLRLIEVDNCVAYGSAELDRAAEEAAKLPIQAINFVPAISFNNQNSIDLNNQARSRLSSMICFALANDPTTGVFSCTI
ncbi:hypothetical protein O3G_MSEX008625 [Manduca sexta]|uniref:Uncharacterized protein n=1 Tax=Manduca sexta TaxID=7130 RepID=A0A921ZAG1_MANSE|nr:hypothetical protein O3G_MSEX008625 [Manduca sexta]